MLCLGITLTRRRPSISFKQLGTGKLCVICQDISHENSFGRQQRTGKSDVHQQLIACLSPNSSWVREDSPGRGDGVFVLVSHSHHKTSRWCVETRVLSTMSTRWAASRATPSVWCKSQRVRTRRASLVSSGQDTICPETICTLHKACFCLTPHHKTSRPPPTRAPSTMSISPVIEYVAPASAVTYTEISPMIEYVAPAPAVTHAALSPAIEYVAPTPVVTYTGLQCRTSDSD